MRRWLAIALVLAAGAAFAADNATLITPCASGCVTVRAKDIGLGVQSPVYILGDTAGNPIYGTAGTANANILTVQGIASMTAIKVDGSGVTQPVSGTVTANAGTGTFTVSGTVTANQGGTWTVQQGTPPWTIQGDSASGASNAGNPVKTGGVFNTTQPTVTTGQTVDAQYTARGAAIVATGVDAFTVGGTVTANAGTGSFTVVQATAANLNATVTGTVTAAQSTAANLNATVVGTGTFAVQAAQSGNWTARVVGNAGAVMDAAGQNAASPANELLIAGQFNTAPTTITSGNISPLQLDSAGNTLVNLKTAIPAGANTIGAVTQASGPWTSNVTQFGGTNISTGTGASGSGIPRVTISNDSSLAANQSVNLNQVAGVAVGDPCFGQAKTNVAISTAAGTTSLVSGVSAKKIYVCSLALVAPSAVSVSLSEGTGATCSTANQAAVIGVATNGTAANGMPFAANGGITLGNGSGSVAVTATAANALCLFQSGTAQIAGNLTYVQQ